MARQFTDEERERMTLGGRWLREERQRRGFEHGTEFAEALGLKQVRLSAYERGLYPVPETVARDIARVLGLSEWAVWRGLQLPQPAGPPDEEAIRQAFQDFPEVMAKVPEIYERVTGEKLREPPPVTGGSGDRRTSDTRKGERRRKTDPGRESAV